MTIQELREKRAKAWDTARDFLDTKPPPAVCSLKRIAKPTMPWNNRLLLTARKSSGWNGKNSWMQS